jgi:hypothetical protein
MQIGSQPVPTFDMNDESEVPVVTGSGPQLSASRMRQRNHANFIRNRSQTSNEN